MDHIAETKVANFNEPAQTTKFLYGVLAGESVVTNGDLLRAIEYPGYPTSTIGNGPGQFTQTFMYNALGERIGQIDQSGVKRSYTYDVAGQQVSDTVSNLPSSMNGDVKSLSYTYDALGRLLTATSKNGAGTPLNQVKRIYNGFGQLTDEYQDHHGEVTSGSPVTHYSYTFAGNASRLTSVSYPSNYTLTYHYDDGSGAIGSAGQMSSISDSTGTLESYAYLGLSTVLKRTRPQGSVADEVITLDLFDRVHSVTWGSTEDFIYSYNAGGNVNGRTNLNNIHVAETYQYDELNRLKSFNRGDDVATNFDHHSNEWRYNAADDPVWTVFWDIHEPQAQALAGDGTLKDGNGRVVRFGDGGSPNQHVAVFDGWGRITGDTLKTARSATNWDTYVQSVYKYDALGRRIEENGHDLYYVNGQVGEEKDSSQTRTRYVWGEGGQLVLRDGGREGSGFPDAPNPTLSDRLWVQTDAAGSTTSLSNTAGAVQARFVYTPYGAPELRDAEFAPIMDATLHVAYQADFEYLHAGRRFDPTAQLYQSGTAGYDPVSERDVVYDPGLQAALNEARGQASIMNSMAGWHEDVGVGESMIPVWGTGKQAYYNFQRGEWVQMLASGYLAISDAVGIGLVVNAITKTALKQMGRELAAEATRTVVKNNL
ncbi:MAG TPA: hypothetical protein VK968_06230, partial [Roseimicrobium sp.]|nr:hypothetical protein [Roseimicrobium sp.]